MNYFQRVPLIYHPCCQGKVGELSENSSQDLYEVFCHLVEDRYAENKSKFTTYMLCGQWSCVYLISLLKKIQNYNAVETLTAGGAESSSAIAFTLAIRMIGASRGAGFIDEDASPSSGTSSVFDSPSSRCDGEGL